MTRKQLEAAAAAALYLAAIVQIEQRHHPRKSHAHRDLDRAAQQLNSASATLQDLAAELDPEEPTPQPDTHPAPE